MKIILASQSPNRQKILKQAGIPFESFSPNIDEESLFRDDKNPEDICLEIAKAKFQVALEKYKHEPCIIACDQMAYCEGQFYGKAYTKDQAHENLQNLQGKTHDLMTAVFMGYQNQTHSFVDINKMHMRHLSAQEIKNYVDEEEPLHCAGSYHVESKGILLFEKIESNDFNSIIGLPLIKITNQLVSWGYRPF